MGNCCSTPSEVRSPDLSAPHEPLQFEGKVFLAYCVSVADGDTVKLNLATHLGTFLYSVRLSHLDAPEMKSSDVEERRHARACKKYVEHLLLHKYCLVQCGKFEKFGRLLGEVYLRLLPGPEHDDRLTTGLVKVEDLVDFSPVRFFHLNSALLRHTSAVPYEGKQKEPHHFDPSLARYHPLYCQFYREVVQECPPPPPKKKPKRKSPSAPNS